MHSYSTLKSAPKNLKYLLIEKLSFNVHMRTFLLFNDHTKAAETINCDLFDHKLVFLALCPSF